MDFPTMGLSIAGIAAVAPFLYRALPQRAPAPPKTSLSEADLGALDVRVRLYERVASLESNQAHQGQTLQGLKADNALLFGKLDDLKTLIIERKSKEKES